MTFFPSVVNRAMKILFWARWCCQICAVAKCELLQANKAAEPGQQAFYIIKISMVSSVVSIHVKLFVAGGFAGLESAGSVRPSEGLQVERRAHVHLHVGDHWSV